MKANELRIGNLVYYADKKTLLKIEGCHICYPSQMYPIPLTEEWLAKFPEWFRIFILEGYANVPTPSGFIDVEYVHTAQNLYFALTGEELK